MGFSVVPSTNQSSKTVTVSDRTLVYTISGLDLETLRQLVADAVSQVTGTGAAPASAAVAINVAAKTVTITWTTVP